MIRKKENFWSILIITNQSMLSNQSKNNQHGSNQPNMIALTNYHTQITEHFIKTLRNLISGKGNLWRDMKEKETRNYTDFPKKVMHTFSDFQYASCMVHFSFFTWLCAYWLHLVLQLNMHEQLAVGMELVAVGILVVIEGKATYQCDFRDQCCP
jgi:cytochrome bd-type quinol oxidase subunit 1